MLGSDLVVLRHNGVTKGESRGGQVLSFRECKIRISSLHSAVELGSGIFGAGTRRGGGGVLIF